MSECFFLDLNVGFHIPHSSLAFCVPTDLPEFSVPDQARFALNLRALPTQLEDKTHTHRRTQAEAHMKKLTHTHLTRSTESNAFMLCNSYSSSLLLTSRKERASLLLLKKREVVHVLDLLIRQDGKASLYCTTFYSVISFTTEINCVAYRVT